MLVPGQLCQIVYASTPLYNFKNLSDAFAAPRLHNRDFTEICSVEFGEFVIVIEAIVVEPFIKILSIGGAGWVSKFYLKPIS